MEAESGYGTSLEAAPELHEKRQSSKQWEGWTAEDAKGEEEALGRRRKTKIQPTIEQSLPLTCVDILNRVVDYTGYRVYMPDQELRYLICNTTML